MIEAAARHKGTSFIEILQNCLVFNDGAFEAFADRCVRDENRILLEHGKPIRFGSGRPARHRGPRTCEPQPVDGGGKRRARGQDLLVHDAQSVVAGPGLPAGCAGTARIPQAFGIFRQVNGRPTTTC